MRLLHQLFSKRRWLLWLPAAPVLFGASDLAELPALVVGGAVLSIPYWLAWWLSDGFTNVVLGTSPSGFASGFVGASDNGAELYYNHEEGHYQSHPGPGACRT